MAKKKFASCWHMVCQLPEETSWSLSVTKIEWIRLKADFLARSMAQKRYTSRAEAAFLGRFIFTRGLVVNGLFNPYVPKELRSNYRAAPERAQGSVLGEEPCVCVSFVNTVDKE